MIKSGLVGLLCYASMFGEPRIKQFSKAVNEYAVIQYHVDSTRAIGFYDLDVNGVIDAAASFKVRQWVNGGGVRGVVVEPFADVLQYDSDGDGTLESLCVDHNGDGVFDEEVILK